MLKEKSEEDLKKIKEELEKAKKELVGQVKTICSRYEIVNGKIPDGVINGLNIDPNCFRERVEAPALSLVDKLLEWKIGGGLFRSNTDWQQEQKIQTEIQNFTNDYIGNYAEKRMDSLEKMTKLLIEEIKKCINGNELLSSGTKKDITRLLESPKIKKYDSAQTVRNLFNQHMECKHHKILWKEWDTRYVKVDEFKKDLRGTLSNIQNRIHDDCVKDFTDTTNDVCKWMCSNFEEKIDDYSNTIKSRLEDKECMEKLCSMLKDLEKKLMDNQEQLNNKIWETKDAAD